MAIVALGGEFWIPSENPWSSAGVPLFSTLAIGLTTANSRLAWVFKVPKTGTLDLFEIKVGTLTNNPDNGIRFSFQTVDASGNPDNTEDQFAVKTAAIITGQWIFPDGFMGASGTGAGAKRSVTKGELLACVIRFENFVASDSVTFATLNTQATHSTNQAMERYHGSSTNAGVAWTKGVDGLNIALKYDDGSYAFVGSPNLAVTLFNTRTFNSGSTPDERGLLFQVPFPARLKGAMVRGDFNNVYDIVLYDSAGTALETITGTVNTGALQNANGGNVRFIFATSHDLTANSNYRLVVKPGASDIVTYDMDMNSAAIREAHDGGATWMSTNRTDAGAWTDVTTNRPTISLIFEGFDDGGGSGGGEHSAVF